MEQSISVTSQVTQAPRFGAGFVVRAGAQVIDLIVHNVLGLVAGLVVGVLVGLYAVATGTSPEILSAKLQASTAVGYIFPLIGYVFYHAISEGIHGATLGKLIFKLHVLKEDGNPAAIGSAVVRSLAFYIDALFFGIVAAASMRSSALQQRLGDKWASTVVVERSTIDHFQWPSAWKFVIAFLIAIAVDGLFFALSLFLKFI